MIFAISYHRRSSELFLNSSGSRQQSVVVLLQCLMRVSALGDSFVYCYSPLLGQAGSGR